MRIIRLTAAACCVLMPSLQARADTNAADRAALVAGVHTLTAPGGIPGDIIVFGENAFTVVTGRDGRANLPLFAYSRLGSGRIVLGGHENFFNLAALQQADNAAFARNIVAWLAAKPLAGIRVSLINQPAALRKLLTDAGCIVREVRAGDVEVLLRQTDVLCLQPSSLDGAAAAVSAVKRWVSEHRGGLLIAGPGWGWQQINSAKDLAKDQSGNQIAMDAGLAFGGAMLSTGRAQGYSIEDVLPANTGALEALSALEVQGASVKPAEMNQITTVLGKAVSILRNGDFAKRIAALVADKGGQVPTRQTPITSAMPYARLKAVLEIQALRKEPAEEVKADPSSSSFPGAVPADARRDKRPVVINTAVPLWHGVGLYAPPGEVITVTIPGTAAGNGLSVRIGEHTDTLWNLDKWERFPEVSMSSPLKEPVTKVASAFGGTVFIEVPDRCRLGEVAVTVEGAVAAPRFGRGVTTKAEWQTVRSAPGPWAELVGNHVALSVPSSAVRELDDPDALMAYWDEVMETCYTFFAAPKRGRPERYCVDRQISAGYMHSGYPIMTGDDVAKTFCDLTVLRGTSGIKCWGFYHEMGHNFQRPEWTWEPFGEVTNNLFSLYGAEKMNGVMVGAHPAMTEAEMAKRVHLVSAMPAAERYYAKDPWYPLTMFWLMRHEFGWEPFTKLFAEFRDLANGERPHTEAQKHDQFLVRFSRLTGHNLTRYLRAWGIEMSAEAEKEVSGLPDWMPQDWR